MLVEPERQRLEEGDVVGHDLLVAEVELVHDDRVHMVVREQVVCGTEKDKMIMFLLSCSFSSKIEKAHEKRLLEDLE